MKNIVRVILLVMVITVCTGCAAAQQAYQTKIYNRGVRTNIPVDINVLEIWDYVAKERPELPNDPHKGYWTPVGPSGDPDYNNWDFKLWENENFTFPEDNPNPEREQVVGYGYEAARKYFRAMFIDTPSFCVNRNEDGTQKGEIVELDPRTQPWWKERAANLNSYQQWLLMVTVGASADDIANDHVFKLTAIERAEGWSITRYPTCQPANQTEQ